MEKKKIITVGAIIAVIVTVVAIIVLNSAAPKKTSVEKEGRKNIENFTSLLINGGTEKELKKVSGIEMIQPLNIMVGEDSYLRETPKDKSGLTTYIENNKKYADNVEKKIKKNFENKITKEDAKNGVVTFKITYKSYYYSVYMMDVQELQKQLLAKAGITDTKDKVNEFKSKVKAMEILDSKLDTYTNKKEKAIALKYTSLDSLETQNAFYSYLIGLEQYTYNDDDLAKLHNDRAKRVAQYITEGINKGILDTNNMLK